MRLVSRTALVAGLLLLAAPVVAQDKPAGETPGRTEAPPSDPPRTRTDEAPSTTPSSRTDAPVPGDTATPTGRTDAPADSRLSDLERRINEQQREIDALKREREAKELKPAPTEKGAVQEATEKPENPQFDWSFQDGFQIKANINGSRFELRPTARLQLDYRAYPHSSTNDAYQNGAPADEFLVRRARLGFTGRFSVFSFDLEADPSRNTTTQLLLGDCWFQYDQFPEFQVRFGHFKAPFAEEDGLTSDNYTDFVERAIVVGSGNQLAPDFHAGAEIFGTFGDTRFNHGFFQYYLAAQNQTQNNVVGAGNPVETARLASEVGPVLLGLSGRWEDRSGIPATATTAPSVTQLSFTGATPGQFTFFKPVLVRGWTQAYNIDLSAYSGPFWARGDFGYGNQQRWRVLADHSTGTGLVTQGFELTAGWLFWAPSKDAAHPLVPLKDWELFNMDAVKSRTRNTGLEIVSTVQWLEIGEDHGGRAGQGGVPAAPSTAVNADKVRSNDCKTVGVGLNFYPIENVKFMADWFGLRIGDQARAESAHSRYASEFLFRAQLEF